MLEVKQFTVNPVEENMYVVSDECGEAVIVDCGCMSESEWQEVKEYIDGKSLKVRHLLNTHLHLDHCLGNRFAERDFGLKPKAAKEEFEFFTEINSGIFMPQLVASLKPAPPFSSIADGEQIDFGNHTLEVIATPGHTLGGVCFYCKEENVLLSGDTLFAGSIGRTDLYGGDWDTLIASVKERLMVLPEETKVYAGHGAATTIEHERICNPYL